MRPNRRWKRGFTLIEVLIALLISAMMITVTLGTLESTNRAVDTIHNVHETESIGPRILELIRDDLANLAYFDCQDYRILFGENSSLGGADADRLQMLVHRRSKNPFHDMVRDEDVWAPLVEVGYVLRQNPRFSDFLELYRREDFLNDDEPYKGGQYTLLYDRITRFEILYYERPEFDPAWEEEWDTEDLEALPFAMEIFLELELQPRRSLESLGILGSNKARHEFRAIFTVPEETRWMFRNRLHPLVHGADEGEEGEGDGDPTGADGGPTGVGAATGRNITTQTTTSSR
ncbi:MAG: prepilin-type N-terminal cleavage/methylation domain-containing protein [Planctomycetota bacterium]|nr:MAG: prepilin-type N-terminal cleavage/methylation domain-containing protein [Planctomycetota bacterium]